MSDPSSPSPTKRPRRLSARYQRFIAEYLKDFNANRAARMIGYSRADNSAGWRLMQRPAIAAELERQIREVQVKLQVSGDDIRQQFAKIAFDPRKPAKGGPTTVERLMALDRLSKIYGLYINKHVFTGATLEQLLSEADKLEDDLGPAMPPPRLRLIDGGRS